MFHVADIRQVALGVLIGLIFGVVVFQSMSLRTSNLRGTADDGCAEDMCGICATGEHCAVDATGESCTCAPDGGACVTGGDCTGCITGCKTCLCENGGNMLACEVHCISECCNKDTDTCEQTSIP